MDRDEMSNLYRGPSIDATYQISDQLALRFQRRRLKCEKLTDDGRQVMGINLLHVQTVTENISHYLVTCPKLF
jgi:hypothetical protein